MSTIWGQHASKLSTFMKNASSPIDCNLRRCHFHRLHFLYRLQTQQLASWNVWQGSSLVDALTGRWQVDGVSFADRTPDGDRTRCDVLMHRSIRRLIFLGIEDAHHKFLNSKRLAEHLSCFDAQIPLSLFDLYRQIFYCRCIAIHFCFFFVCTGWRGGSWNLERLGRRRVAIVVEFCHKSNGARKWHCWRIDDSGRVAGVRIDEIPHTLPVWYIFFFFLLGGHELCRQLCRNTPSSPSSWAPSWWCWSWRLR